MLTLNRPRNTLTTVLLDGLHQALSAAEADPESRAVVFRSQGETFCAGMDFDEAARENHGELAEATGRFFDLLARCTTSGLTVIAIVEGRAVGGGVGLAAASDFVVATHRAQFSLPEALWGLLPCCVLPFLVRRVGFQLAYAMTLSTLPVTAARAAEAGLVDELTEDPERALRSLLARVTRLAPVTVAEAKRYCAEFAPVTPATRRRAVEEFHKLSSSSLFSAAIMRYARDGRYPWESPEVSTRRPSAQD
jgi:polyketide biosynthesis enoyl-CoA hydratase PksH